VDKVYKREDLYRGRCVHKAPDIIALLSDDYVTSRTDDMEGESFLGVLSESEKLRRGNAEHRQNGIYIARGYPVKKDFIQNAANVVDIAPTILYLMNLPVPDDMDGKVLVDSIDDDYLCTHPVETIRSVQDDWVPDEEKAYTEQDAKEVRDRLRGLGYLE
jgi:predicted AlkP superfamily phosphohydrolase/phosphomutase